MPAVTFLLAMLPFLLAVLPLIARSVPFMDATLNVRCWLAGEEGAFQVLVLRPSAIKCMDPQSQLTLYLECGFFPLASQYTHSLLSVPEY